MPVSAVEIDDGGWGFKRERKREKSQKCNGAVSASKWTIRHQAIIEKKIVISFKKVLGQYQ